MSEPFKFPPPTEIFIELDPPERRRKGGFSFEVDPGRKGRVYVSQEYRDGWRNQQKSEKEAALEAERQKIISEERAREPRRCAPMLTKPEIMQIRPDAKLLQAARSSPTINQVCIDAYMASGPDILSQWHENDSLVNVTHASGNATIQRFAEVRKNLSAFSLIGINALTRGAIPERRRVAVKFATSSWRSLSHLSQIKPELIVAAAGGGFFVVFNCVDWSKKRLTDFAVQALKLNGALVEAIPTPGRVTATLEGAMFETLHGAGLLKHKYSETVARNYVLAWQPNKSKLPEVPQRGRRA